MYDQTATLDPADLGAEIEAAIESKPVEVSDRQPRYGISLLIHIPLAKHIGNQIIMDVNKKDPNTGQVIKNIMYYPRMLLMPLRNIKAPIPAEGYAGRTFSGAFDNHSRTFNPNMAGDTDVNRQIEKTARQVAEYTLLSYKEFGYINLNALTGKYEKFAGAKEVFQKVLPLDDHSVFPRIPRHVLGETFAGPFIDEVIEYLINGPKEWESFNAPVFRELYTELLAGAQNAYRLAKSRIAETEADMSANPPSKRGYDVRSPLFDDAPEPLDPLYLAHTNQAPKSERILQQTQKQAEANNGPISEMAKSMLAMAEKFTGSGGGNNPENALTGMTQDALSEMINKAAEERLAKLMADGQLVPATPSVNGEAPIGVEPPKLKAK